MPSMIDFIKQNDSDNAVMHFQSQNLTFLQLLHFYKAKSNVSPSEPKTLVVKNRSFKSHFYSAKDPDPPPFPHKKPYKMHLLISFSSQPDINVLSSLSILRLKIR